MCFISRSKMELKAASFVVFAICIVWVKGDHLNSTFQQTRECATYPDRLVSMPDLHNMVRYKEKRYPGYEIDNVKSSNYERSFYWCEFDVEETESVHKRYRHFGFNATHWWVEKGCGGWFWITECKPVTSSGGRVDSSLYDVNPGYYSGIRPTPPQGVSKDLRNEENDPLPTQSAVKPSTSLGSSSPTQIESVKTLDPSFPNAPSDTKVISSSRHTDTMMSTTSDRDSVEGNAGHGPPRGARVSGGHLAPQMQSPQGSPSDIPGQSHSDKASTAVRDNPSDDSVDAMYKGWPQVGYNFPTTLEMWDALNRATWVDVKQQLGFYSKTRRPHSATFD